MQNLIDMVMTKREIFFSGINETLSSFLAPHFGQEIALSEILCPQFWHFISAML